MFWPVTSRPLRCVYSDVRAVFRPEKVEPMSDRLVYQSVLAADRHGLASGAVRRRAVGQGKECLAGGPEAGGEQVTVGVRHGLDLARGGEEREPVLTQE